MYLYQFLLTFQRTNFGSIDFLFWFSVFIFIDFQSFNLGLPSPYSFLRWELNHFVSLFLSNVSVQSTQFPSTHYFCCISKFGYVMFSFSSN